MAVHWSRQSPLSAGTAILPSAVFSACHSGLQTVSVAVLAAVLLGSAVSASAAPQGNDGLDDVQMEALRDALRARDELAQAWFRLGAGDAVGARRDIKRMLRASPRDPDLLHLLGMAAAADRRWLEARIALRRSLRQRPDGWVALHLVNLFLDKGRVVAAGRVLAKLPNELQGNPQVRRARAYVKVGGGDLPAALEELAGLEQAAPSAEVSYQVALLHIETGDARAGADALARAVEHSPSSGRYRRELFEQLASLADWAALVEASSRTGAAAAGGGLDSYYRGLGMHGLGRSEEAVRAFAAVGKHGTPDPVALAGSAGYLLQLGAYTQAERAARASLGGSHEDATLHHLLAMVLSRQGRESEALAHYRRAVDEKSDEATYRFDLLVSLCELDRSAEFQSAGERATKDFPEDQRFSQVLARCGTAKD